MIPLLGEAYRHSVMALDNDFSACEQVDPRVEVKRVAAPASKSMLRAPFELRRIIAGAGADVVLTYNWGAMDAVLGALIGGGGPVIHTEDGFHSDEARRLHWRRRVARRILLNRVYQTVVPSRTLLFVAREQFRLRADKVRLIANGVDTERFHPGRDDELRLRWGIGEREIVFGTVGRLRAEKSLGWMIEAFATARLEGARLVVVGDGPCAAEWRNQAASLGQNRNVVFAGNISDTAPVYRAFDVFLMSSLTEQMPLALLEAMASGLPALCTEVGDTAEILGPRAGTAVPAGERGRYMAAMSELLGSAELRRSQGEAGRARVMEAYSLRRMVEQYDALFRSAAASRNSGNRQ